MQLWECEEQTLGWMLTGSHTVNLVSWDTKTANTSPRYELSVAIMPYYRFGKGKI